MAMSLLNTTVLQAIAFVLFLISLPLLSLGTMEEQELLWYAGLALLLIAGILPPLARFIGQDDDDEEEAEEADEAKEADDEDEESDDDDEESDDDDEESDDDKERADSAPSSAGPIGRGTGSTGREPHRERVKEQEEHSSSEEDK